MKLSTLWSAYQKAIEMYRVALAEWNRIYEDDGEYDNEYYRAALWQFWKRDRQTNKLAERITAELAAIETARPWTYITDDRATLPPEHEDVLLAWRSEKGDEITQSNQVQGEWETSELRIRVHRWEIYTPGAWRPLLKAPPVRGKE